MSRCEKPFWRTAETAHRTRRVAQKDTAGLWVCPLPLTSPLELRGQEPAVNWPSCSVGHVSEVALEAADGMLDEALMKSRSP